jgi:Flp pilus assembly pilin Flp
MNNRCRPGLGRRQHEPVTRNFREDVMLNALKRNQKGQDMVEYALLASFISIVAIATLRLIGPLILAIYNAIRAALA